MGGRIDDIAVVENNPSTYYVGAATGGLWKTINNGTTFEPMFDGQGSTSIGDVAIAPSDPSIIWVGTGEPNNRQSSSWGDGVYRSLDAGKTWHKHGTARHQTHRPRGDRFARSKHRLRGRAGPSVGTKQRARRVQNN